MGVRLGAKAATGLSLTVIALIAAFALSHEQFELGLPGWQSDTAGTIINDALGVTVEPLDRATAETLGISPRKGLVITSLREKSPAAQAGIRPGDVIERIDEIRVRSPDEAAAALKRARVSDIILTLNRRGHYVIVHLPIRALPDMRD